jgi:uncharacterized protein with PIN domain
LAEITLTFHGNLPELLVRRLAGSPLVRHTLERRASVKDVVESFGIPHPEIGKLAINGRQIGFDALVANRDDIEIWPLTPPCDVLTPTVLRPGPLTQITFMVDINVAKLAVLLRMAGFDTLYDPDLTDGDLAETAADKKRILLTRDRNLLKRRNVEFGHLVRETEPRQQWLEVVQLYGLADKLQPFSRCLRCNGLLVPVDKQTILHRLEPLTIKYYDLFQRCADCDRVYWSGSHRERMDADLTTLVHQCGSDPR